LTGRLGEAGAAAGVLGQIQEKTQFQDVGVEVCVGLMVPGEVRGGLIVGVAPDSA